MLGCLLLPFAALSGAYVIPEIVFQKGGVNGGVASENAECSRIGRNVLLNGGNAVDSLVATTFCIGVVAPHHSGIGGGGFAVVRDENGEYEVIDFREAAPAAASENMYDGNVEGSVTSGLSVAIPGEVRGLEYMHKKYGKLPWEYLVEPASEVARYGFKVGHDTVRYMNAVITKNRNFFLEDPAWAEHFAPNGKLVEVGDIMYRKNYADTLDKIGKHGADAFYKGKIAEALISVIQKENGTMTLDDLESYEVIRREPLEILYRGYKLYTSGVPSSGAILMSILKTMEQYPVEDWDDIHLTTHRFNEAMRFAYGSRLELGDPDFVPESIKIEKAMLDENVAKSIRGRILDDRTQPIEVYDPREIYTTEGQGTSHIVTADKDGMATSVTTTINLLYGSLIMDPVTGVVLNNEMNDFSIPNVSNEFGFAPSAANFIRPGKRPLSSITPVIIEIPADAESGTPSLLYSAVGAAGGSRIISATTQVIWHLVEHDFSLPQALAEPRLHDQLMPNHVLVEYGFDNTTVESMRQRGHEIVRVAEGLSAVHAVRVEGGVFEAEAEPRQKDSGGATA